MQPRVFWIRAWLCAAYLRHDNPECSRREAEETFNRFNGSASVQLTTRDWHHTVILVGDRLLSETRFKHRLSHDSGICPNNVRSNGTTCPPVLVESSSSFCFWRAARTLTTSLTLKTIFNKLYRIKERPDIFPIHGIVTPREGSREMKLHELKTLNTLLIHVLLWENPLVLV